MLQKPNVTTTSVHVEKYASFRNGQPAVDQWERDTHKHHDAIHTCPGLIIHGRCDDTSDSISVSHSLATPYPRAILVFAKVAKAVCYDD